MTSDSLARSYCHEAEGLRSGGLPGPEAETLQDLVSLQIIKLNVQRTNPFNTSQPQNQSLLEPGVGSVTGLRHLARRYACRPNLPRNSSTTFFF